MKQNSVPIIYASTSGNVEFVVEKIAERWLSLGLKSELMRAEIVDLDLIDQNSTFLFATSTWEHGVLNPFFDKVLERIKDTDCVGKKACLVGLGDRRYEPFLFCNGIKIVKKAFLDSRGQILGRPLLINQSPYHQVDTHVFPWAEGILSLLK